MALETGLAGKKALITGGSVGIGLAIAKALAREGVQLAIASRHPDPVGIDELKKLTETVVVLQADVSQESDVVRMVQGSVRALDGLDIYVNNAARNQFEPVSRITSKGFYSTINTNLTACVWACREVSKHLIAQRSGSILIIGSTVRAAPSYRAAAYRISKMGLKMYMETLAIELAPYKIRVNMITPGHNPTRLTAFMSSETQESVRSQIALRRSGDPNETGPAAVLLLSDQISSYTTGADLVIDGGLTLRPLVRMSDEELFRLNL